jgi:alpha-tubulin suppressor-like RCC1 family protein
MAAAGWAHTCVVTTEAAVRCWGLNTNGQLGTGTTDDVLDTCDTQVVLDGALAVVAGGAHTCALGQNGGVRCWGLNEQGQLGDGTGLSRSTVPDTDVLTSVIDICAGDAHTCAVTSTGAVFCWGANSFGQVGDGTNSNKLAPTAQPALLNAAEVTCGLWHTCALTLTGGVRCWGLNAVGQLGDETTKSRNVPHFDDIATIAIQVAAGAQHTCALFISGAVACWGLNNHGQLGTDDTVDSVVPIGPVITGISQLMLGPQADFTCALSPNGALSCWGDNTHGQLGNGESLIVVTNTTGSLTSPDVLAPPPPSLLLRVDMAALGAGHMCAVGPDGLLRCWGLNENGQLGDGTLTDRLVPPTALLNVTG